MFSFFFSLNMLALYLVFVNCSKNNLNKFYHRELWYLTLLSRKCKHWLDENSSLHRSKTTGKECLLQNFRLFFEHKNKLNVKLFIIIIFHQFLPSVIKKNNAYDVVRNLKRADSKIQLHHIYFSIDKLVYILSSLFTLFHTWIFCKIVNHMNYGRIYTPWKCLASQLYIRSRFLIL